MEKQTKQPDKYKVGVVFINDFSIKKSNVPGRDIEQNPMHYRRCATLKRARHLINTVYGAGTNNPTISLANIYEIEKPAGTPPLARWTIEKQWNNEVTRHFQGTK